VLTQGSFCFRN